MMSKIWIPLFLILIFRLHGTITLYNDSAYPLVAKIFNAQGILMSSTSLSPGETYRWDYEQGAFDALQNQPYTPYTVRWYCNTAPRPYDYSSRKQSNDKEESPEYENEYANWPQVPPGATITAQSSPQGTHACVVKKKSAHQTPRRRARASSESGEQSPPPPIPSQNPTPETQKEDWSNDGGENWKNDGGKEWEND